MSAGTADAMPSTSLSVSQLCVTEGTLTAAGERLAIESPKLRAVAALATDPAAELRFTYLGATNETTALGSGAVRRQIGLKLRAQNGCNLVYAMWRIEPKNEIVVQVKRNKGQSSFAECENRGYRNVAPRHAVSVAEVAVGSSHVLRAAMRGADLTVWADGAVVWEGSVGDDVLDMDGPVGFRSDNGRFAVAFVAGSDGSPRAARACVDAKGE
jgi:hypothetical protein